MMSRLRLLVVAVMIALGTAMLAIPWVMPFERAHGHVAVFLVAGVAELVLGSTLAYLILREPFDDET